MLSTSLQQSKRNETPYLFWVVSDNDLPLSSVRKIEDRKTAQKLVYGREYSQSDIDSFSKKERKRFDKKKAKCEKEYHRLRVKRKRHAKK